MALYDTLVARKAELDPDFAEIVAWQENRTPLERELDDIKRYKEWIDELKYDIAMREKGTTNLDGDHHNHAGTTHG